MVDRSELTRDEKVTWYMAEAADMDEAAQAVGAVSTCR